MDRVSSKIPPRDVPASGAADARAQLRSMEGTKVAASPSCSACVPEKVRRVAIPCSRITEC
eukprot:679931-Prymnesium_polylepis.1